MAEDKKEKKNNELDLVDISWDELKKNYEDILKARAPIWRKKKDGSMVTIPAGKLELYIGGKKIEGISFFIEKDWRTRIVDKGTVLDKVKEASTEKSSAPKKEPAPPKDKEFDSDIQRYKKMSLKDRQEQLSQNVDEMAKKVELYNKIDLPVVNELVGVVSNSWHINKTSLQEHKSSSEHEEMPDLPSGYLDKMVQKTNMLVDSIVALLSKDKFKFSDLNSIERISTGSATIDHINKVVFRFIPFCIYYNECFRTGKIARIRGSFEDKYMGYYKTGEVSLEVIFKGGMRRLTDEELHNYSLGALLHDIGKFPNVDYHDNVDANERRKIMSHSPYSYNMIIKAKRFSMDAAYMALLHHEYYGDPTGYNFSVQLFPKLSSRAADSKITNYYNSYDINDLKEGKAIAFFPAKLLEIVDVFDIVLEQEKKRIGLLDAGHPIEDALKIIMQEYVYKNLRLDPVLFYIFTEFMKEYMGPEENLDIDFF